MVTGRREYINFLNTDNLVAFAVFAEKLQYEKCECIVAFS